MRACLKMMSCAVFTVMCALHFSAQAEDISAATVKSITLGRPGALAVAVPHNWTMTLTNMNLAGNPPSVELHSLSNTVAIRLTIYWDGFGGSLNKFTDAKMPTMVSNVAVRQYIPISVEKTLNLEKLEGPGVTGLFARFTDAGWTPVVKDEFHNLTTGMFHCSNLWGNFDLLSNDKDGPTFKEGLKVMESLHRK